MTEPVPTDPAEKGTTALQSVAPSFLRRLAQVADVDTAVLFGVLARVWGVAAGPVTLLLIASHFTPELQGYYYTFLSLLALHVFFELGLGQVIIQYAAHEWSRLRLDGKGRITGDALSLSRLVSLGRFSLRWFAVAGALLALGLMAAGALFFADADETGVDWLLPWIGLCVLTGISLWLLPLLSLLEGCNQVASVYLFRLLQGVLGSFVVWTAIVLGAGLWVPVVGQALGLALTAVFLLRRHGGFVASFLRPADGPRIGWRDEVWPMQWRIALSWVAGYFCFSLFTPLLFKFHGPVAAGQMGMTWVLIGALSGVSTTFVQTKAPRFGVLIAKRDYVTLDRLALRVGVTSVAVCLAGAIAIAVGIHVLNVIEHSLASRLLPLESATLFLIATVLLQISTPQSIYLRAHKREPFLGLSVAGGLMTGLLTVVLGYRWGALGMGAGYLAVTLLFSLPVGTAILMRCRAAWHGPGADGAEESEPRQRGEA